MANKFIKDIVDAQVTCGNDKIYLLDDQGRLIYQSHTVMSDDVQDFQELIHQEGKILRGYVWRHERCRGQICDLQGKTLGDWSIKYTDNGAMLFCHYQLPSTKEVMAYLEPFMQVVNLMPGNTFVKDVDGVYMAINLALLERSDYSTHDQIVGKTDIELWPDSAQRIIRHDQQVIESRKTMFFIEKLTRMNGQVVYYAGHKSPIIDKTQRVVGVMGNLIDITSLKQKEFDLLAEREAAVKENKAKMDFIRNMQHDIRTPFTGIIGTTTILQESESDDHKKSLLQIIQSSAEELLTYCNDIIDYANIENGQVAIIDRVFDLRGLAHSIYELEAPAAQAKGLELSYEYDNELLDNIVGDPFRIQRILINLVSNSIKFTSRGTVSFSIRKIKSFKNHRSILIAISVSDSGMGIPETQQDQIFEKLTRVSPANKGLFKGRGFGLKIVKQFTEDLDGDLNLQSMPGVGTTVTVILPLKEPLVQDMFAH